MKPSLSRLAVKIVLFFIFLFLFSDIGQQPNPLALVLDRCGGVYAAMIKRQSQLLLRAAQRSWFKANNGINGRGPAGGGKDAVYAGCEIEPTERSATEAGSAL